MYLPDLLNSYGLFQHTSNLNAKQEFADDLALLLSRATSAVVCINRMDFLQKQCFAEFDLFDDQITDFDDRIVYYSESLVELQNQISPLLSALRMMQDILNQLIRRKYPELNLPRSISDSIKGIDKYDLPIEIKDLLNNYWKYYGKRIRDLRILDQHYSSIVDQIFLQTKPDRRIVLLFLITLKRNQVLNGLSKRKLMVSVNYALDLTKHIKLLKMFFNFLDMLQLL